MFEEMKITPQPITMYYDPDSFGRTLLSDYEKGYESKQSASTVGLEIKPDERKVSYSYPVE